MISSQSNGVSADERTRPSLSLTELHLVSGEKISLTGGDVVIVVGPNNVGKTALIQAISQKLRDTSIKNPVLDSLSYAKTGTPEEVVDFILQTARILPTSSPADPTYQAFGENTGRSRVKHLWKEDSTSLDTLSRYFCHYLTTEARLSAGNPAPAIKLTSDPPSHPIHFLQRDDSQEITLSKQFKQAFNMDLVVHRNAGNQVPLYTGEKPNLKDGEDRVSLSYVRRLEEMTPLVEQGDGMRSFASALLHTAVGQEDILLIDEPEAFLHPPQARLLGQLLVQEKPAGRQLFVSTHSGDVVRGILDTGCKSVRVIRLSRTGNHTSASELSSAEIESLWSDSLLKHSNILDGLFHSMVVVCESDSDARFYSAVAAATEDKDGRHLDVMFTHSGGKQRLPMVARALSRVKVPVRVAADFDIIREENLLRELVEAVGANWGELSKDWAPVRNAIAGKKPALDAEEVASAICKELEAVEPGLFPKELGVKIRRILSRSSPWSEAKKQGRLYVPSGTPASHCERLLKNLAAIGVHVVPEGEVEGFVRTVGGHGQAWVNKVLLFDLAADSRLESARRYVADLMP